MEHLVLLIAAALTLVGAAFSKLLADEFKAWAPTIVSSILAVAVKALPPSQRDRAAEEWTSHVNELPGDLSKIVCACGCILAAWKIDGLPFRVGKRARDIALAGSLIAALIPLFGFVFVLAKLASPRRPAFSKQRRTGMHGKKFMGYKFRTTGD